MADQEKNPQQQEQDQPFTTTSQVGFNLTDIILNTNNEYSAKALKESKVAFFIPSSNIHGKVGVNTFRNPICAHYISHPSEYVAPPSITIVRQWFSTIRYGKEISAKGTLKKSLLPPSIHNWGLKLNQPEGPPFTTHIMAICLASEQVVLKAPTYSSIAESVPQGKKPIAKARHKKHFTSSKHPFYVQQREDNRIIVVDDSEDEETNIDKDDKAHNDETDDTSVQTPSSPRSIQLQELKNEVLLLQSQKHKLELEKAKDEAEVADLKARPLFPNMEQLNELLVKSLNDELSKFLSTHDYSSSFSTEHKELPSKFLELFDEVKWLKKLVNELEVELPTELKEIPSKLEDFKKTVTSLTSQVAELKTLQWELPEDFLSIPINVATILAKVKILDVLPRLLDVEEGSTESDYDNGEPRHMSNDPMVESSMKKKMKKFDFVTKGGEHIHLTKEQISVQKKIEEDAKAEAAKREGELRRAKLIDLFGPEVVENAYKEKLQYDRYYDKMSTKDQNQKSQTVMSLQEKGQLHSKYIERMKVKLFPA
nr:hypothetical protein [Tanacetum cinerariifolium]